MMLGRRIGRRQKRKCLRKKKRTSLRKKCWTVEVNGLLSRDSDWPLQK